MKSLSPLLLLLLTCACSFSQPLQDSVFLRYKKMNDADTVLRAFKDNDEVLKIKLIQVEHINKSRLANGVQKVQLDILASRVANKFCREAAENDYVGHWNLAGEKPYHRYAFAGGKDHVMENSHAAGTSGQYKVNTESMSEKMKNGHERFMAEQAPKDGHKRNCLAPHHNFVGIGVYLNEKEFRYCEEFIDRYLDFGKIKPEVKPKEEFICNMKPKSGYEIERLIVYYEPFVHAMSPSQINDKKTCNDFTDTRHLQISKKEIATHKKKDAGYEFSFAFEKKGLYYLQTKLRRVSDSTAEPASLITASGIVISVE